MTRLRGQAIAVVGIPLLISLAALAGIAQLQREAQSAERLTMRSNTRLFTSESLLLRLVDAETGVRGYAATHDARFREPYVRARRSLPVLIDAVQGTSERQPAAIRRLSVPIARQARAQVTLLASIDREIANGASTAVPARLLAGKAGMDRLRASIARLQATERSLYFERRTRASASETDLQSAILAAGALSFLGSIAAIFLFMNRVVRRLAIVITHTERVGNDDELGSALGGHDEIRSLDLAVHRMATAIRTRTAELALTNAVLDERNTELGLANLELETFTYSVSHDLRAPVRAVQSFSRRLEAAYGASLDGEGRRLLDVIRSESTRMGRLIDDLLSFSKLARQHVQTGPVNMTELVSEAILHATRIDGAAASITVATLPEASGDRTLLAHVWENLIGNALKYSSMRERPIVAISGSLEGSSAVYHISDNGIGFSMVFAEKIFGVFERLHGINAFPGSGVGLSIVKRIVERHGGRVWALGTPGEGATFSFSLPANEAL